MRTATMRIDPDYRVAGIDRRLFGSMVEHVGRGVYGGLYEPTHPDADAAGLRDDVVKLVEELGTSIVRYPGGNFVSSYRWEEGIGPVPARPRRLDLAWRAIECNAFGLHEFMEWTQRTGVDPFLVVNLGTRGPAAAADLVEYCNLPGGTTLSDLRRENGAQDAFRVRLWGLGNEMDGSWQVGHRSAHSYGETASQAAQAMKLVDPSIEVVLAGSSHPRMPSFAAWEAESLAVAYEYVDFVSLHQYYDPEVSDGLSFLASAVAMDQHINDVVATVDHVRARLGRSKYIQLAYDEWNVWYESRFVEPPAWGVSARPGSVIEDSYSARDAVVTGSLLMTLLRHADRVKVACQAQLVNVIAPIRTEPAGPAWRQASFYPLALTARHARGDVLRTSLRTPILVTPRFGEVGALDVTATYEEASGHVSLFAVNRDSVPLRLCASMTGFPQLHSVAHLALADEDPSAVNHADNPQRVAPRHLPVRPVIDDVWTTTLPALSWSVAIFHCRPKTLPFEAETNQQLEGRKEVPWTWTAR